MGVTVLRCYGVTCAEYFKYKLHVKRTVKVLMFR